MQSTVKMPAFDLTGKTAIVTGGASGIGFAIAATYAHSGANVIITARRAANVLAAAEEISAAYAADGARVVAIPADSSIQTDIDRVLDRAKSEFGGVDILVNCAGISGKTAPVLSDECDEANFDAVTGINLKGVFLFSKAAAKHMADRKQGGKIINIASVGGLIGGKGVIAYGAAKAGVLSLTKTLANELARFGITVNAICPGYVVTPLNEDVFSNDDIRKKMESRTALRRLGSVEEIAGPALALASDCFGYMTGTYLLLDGGQTIGG